MTEPTTQTLVELRRLAEAVRDAELPHPKWLAENAFKAALNYGTVIELLDALEAQARMWDSLNVYCGQAERQRDDAIAERDTLRAELEAIRTVPVGVVDEGEESLSTARTQQTQGEACKYANMCNEEGECTSGCAWRKNAQPMAYAVFASNGNIRIWGHAQDDVKRIKAEFGSSLIPLYAHPQATEPAPKRPINCGTGHCSCIECVMEPAPSTAGERAQVVEDLLMYAGDNGYSHIDYADTMRHAAALLQSTALPDHSEQHLDMVAALPVGELTDEQKRNGVQALKTTLYRGGSKVYLPAESWIEDALCAAILAAARSQPVLEPLTDDPLQGAVDWFLQADGEFFCVATVQRTLRIGYNRAKRLCDIAKERAAHGITQGGKV